MYGNDSATWEVSRPTSPSYSWEPPDQFITSYTHGERGMGLHARRPSLTLRHSMSWELAATLPGFPCIQWELCLKQSSGLIPHVLYRDAIPGWLGVDLGGISMRIEKKQFLEKSLSP
ncbi:hypothetical protein BS78_K238000 [Paspalum vaginatum]|uniref:Uncharacterized protein n=1 Tax=Paspalum vaginatum TaxID=158149 RepID=A0A9W8CGM3_9POAL|nr:hypothetical protein BS78_K238000 [Paspalum vaginatum]